MRKISQNFNQDFPFKFRENKDNSGFLLWQVSYMWQQEQRRTLLKYHDISQMDYIVLSSTYYLMINKVDVTPTILSKHTKIEPVGIAQLMRSLEKRNLIERYRLDNCGKSHFLKVSDKGIELLNKAIITVESFDDRFFKIVSKKIDIFNKNLNDLIKSNE
jgi:DNA-binding MarR family transcriptional regulator